MAVIRPRVFASSSHHRPYDDPDISAREFLTRVMHAADVSIRDRMRAADILLRLFPPAPVREPVLTVVIGGIPAGYVDIPEPRLCTKCGWEMPFPCQVAPLH
jgi:hypothetical protein